MNKQTLETKPSREVIDQVFLSPRVLDKAAFEEFAGIIKQLIERATEDTRRLQAAATEADTIYRKLAEATPRLESRLSGADDATRALETGASEFREGLARAAECAVRAESAEARVERATRETIAQLESRLLTASESGKTYIEGLRTGVEERAREIAESALRAIEAAGLRLQDLEVQSTARITAIAERMEQVFAAAERRADELTGRIASAPGMNGIARRLVREETVIEPIDPTEPLVGEIQEVKPTAGRKAKPRRKVNAKPVRAKARRR